MKVNIPLVVGIIAAATALIGYLLNAAAGRRVERARRYADALNAVEKYKQLPFTFARMHDGTPESRAKLAEMLGETQVALSFHRRWLTLESPELGAAYNAFVDKVRQDNSTFRKDALARPAPATDIEIEIGSPYNYDARTERENCIAVMRKHLSVFRMMI
jgi:hypothetical protein